MLERTTPLSDTFTAVRSRFANTPFGQIEFQPQTASTNEDATARLHQTNSAGVTIVADYQTCGRGRKGRSWNAPPGSSLLFTTILPREVRREDLWALPFWTALCVGGGLAGLGFPTQLQWPNDILLLDRKCCGILCISRVTGETARVGCGIGLNVQRPMVENEPITPPPSYLSDVRRIQRASVLSEILGRFLDDLWLLDYPPEIASRWQSVAALAGTTYRLQLDYPPETIEAVAQELGPAGELIVTQNGRRRVISLADARVIRR